MRQPAELQNILNRAVDQKKIFGTAFSISYKGQSWSGAAGNLQPESQFFIASTTKLFVSAIVMDLRGKGLLRLDDPIGNYLDSGIMRGLHVLRGKDYSGSITIRHLLAHSSGLPCYFESKNSQGQSIQSALFKGVDRGWTPEGAIELSKTFQPYFAPGSPGKAHYSDTNFQLLGLIMDRISGKTFSQNCRELIFEPLGMNQTYIFEDCSDSRPATMHYKRNKLPIPRAMRSFGPDGGGVSTSTELLRFIEAYLKGRFFPPEYLAEMRDWNKIFFPLQAGIGIHRFKLPWYFNPNGIVPELIGHSGLSGTMAYGNLSQDLFVAGTVNQIAYPSGSFQVAVKLILKVLKG